MDDEENPPIIIIPPGDYSIYRPPPPDKLAAGRHEKHILSYWSDPINGVVVEVVQATDLESKFMNTLMGRRKIMTEFPPDPQRYPDLLGEVHLGPRERLVVRKVSVDDSGQGHSVVITHTAYQELWPQKIKRKLGL